MLTVKQKAIFQELKQGKLTPKQKADFYYRMSKIFKAEAESTIKEMSMLLDEIPDTYLDKIDFYAMANDSMELLEKLAERLEPAPVYNMEDGKIVSRRYRVEINNPLPDIIVRDDYKPLAILNVTYQPDESEAKFIDGLQKFIDRAERSIAFAEREIGNCSMEEFNIKLKRLKGKQNLIVGLSPMTGK